jgi:hypothetical protein
MSRVHVSVGLAFAAALVLGLALAPSGANAEWLYFKDGTVQELDGPWKVRGRMIQFTTRAGALQMVAAEEVDVAVSEKLSAKALPSSNLNEVRSGPDDRASGRTLHLYESRTAIDANWDWVEWSATVSETAGGKSEAGRCVTAIAHAVTDGGTIVVQIATTIENVELYGLRAVDAPALRTLVEGQNICLQQKEFGAGRDESGRYRAYAYTRGGLDVGLELIRQSYAAPSDEPHRQSAEYRRAHAARSGD